MDLVKQVEEAIVDLRQKEIDKLSEVNDSINNTNDLLISKIQEQIDADRQARDNAKAEQELTDMRSRLAYLGADTSGVNALTMTDLTKEVTEAEQDLQDERIDQAIANLEDANEKAAEQRERQIDLLTSQLATDQELGKIAAKAKEIVDQGLKDVNDGIEIDTTTIGKIIAASAKWEYLTTEEREKAISELSTTGKQAADWVTTTSEKQNDPRGNQPPQGTITLDNMPVDDLRDILQKFVTDNNLREGDRARWGQALQHSKVQIGTEKVNALEAWHKYSSRGGDVSKIVGTTDQKTVEFSPFVFDSTSNSRYFKPNNLIRVTQDGVDYRVYGTHNLPEEESKLIDNQLGGEYPCAFGRYKSTDIVARGEHGWFYVDEAENYEKDFQKIKQLIPYKTGGLADFTGPAWLDGTKSKPEIVLNQKDSANFLVLRDILSEVLNGSVSLSKLNEKQTGDNYYNIDINVEKLEDDYDVDQIADKIRRMIYDDATYRNVNAINLIR